MNRNSPEEILQLMKLKNVIKHNSILLSDWRLKRRLFYSLKIYEDLTYKTYFKGMKKGLDLLPSYPNRLTEYFKNRA